MLFVDTIAQPWPGTHFAVTKTPWSSKDQWPRLRATSGPTMYQLFSQTTILGTRESDESIYASVRIAINDAYVRIERLTLDMPRAMLPAD